MGSACHSDRAMMKVFMPISRGRGVRRHLLGATHGIFLTQSHWEVPNRLPAGMPVSADDESAKVYHWVRLTSFDGHCTVKRVNILRN